MSKLSKPTVAVGLSGGVDSSVAACLLKKAGYQVFGLFMKNWEETDDGGNCMAAQDFQDAAEVCDSLGIPCHTVNFAREYKERVFNFFLKGYASGDTPNPDILCNKEIKFNLFLKKALNLGADLMATGHYARIDGSYNLLKGKDRNKDQSYFLYTLKKDILKKVIFPLGNLEKTKVRKIAQEQKLPTAAKKDSTGICFIGKRAFRPFLSRFLPARRKGFFVDLQGQVVGEHSGAFFYTIGQREGLKIGGKGPAWFVVEKDVKRNLVFVAQGADHPALFSRSLTAFDLSWVSGGPPAAPFSCRAKIRYRQKDQDCIVEKITGGLARVIFEEPQRAVTPLQSIVFYQKERCLGGGLIKAAGPSLYQKQESASQTLTE